MRDRYKNTHIVDFLFVLGLFFIFTISAIFLVLIGSTVYKNIVSRMDTNYDTRTSFAYVTEKLRQSDCADSVSVVSFDGCEALQLKQDYDGVEYATYLYSYNGKLMELFTGLDNALPASSGQEIFDLKSFEVETLNSSCYRITITLPDDDSYQFIVSSRSDDTK